MCLEVWLFDIDIIFEIMLILIYSVCTISMHMYLMYDFCNSNWLSNTFWTAVAQWLERWTGNPDVASLNADPCYTSKEGLTNHLINGSGLDRKWQLWMLFSHLPLCNTQGWVFFCKIINLLYCAVLIKSLSQHRTDGVFCLQNHMLSRLTSLHRSVIRVLHVVIRSMSDADVCRAVLVGCRDLVTVIRRLMLCSSQLTTETTLSQSDDIVSLLDDIMVLYKHCCWIIFAKCFLASFLTHFLLVLWKSYSMQLNLVIIHSFMTDVLSYNSVYSCLLYYSSFVVFYTFTGNFLLFFCL